jgi:hypothetical protein
VNKALWAFHLEVLEQGFFRFKLLLAEFAEGQAGAIFVVVLQKFK